MDKLIIADRYEVNLGMPFPDFDSFGAEAFAVTDLKNGQRPVYALLQKSGYPLRQRVYEKLQKQKNPNLCAPRAKGVVKGPNGLERLITIADFPVGGRAYPGGRCQESLTEQQLREYVLPNLVASLHNLHHNGLAHRGISLDALVYLDRSGQDLGLVECYTSPPGAQHAACYEPLHRAAAAAIGRGEGGPSCDMFALGVVLLALYKGHEFTAHHQPDESLYTARVNFGSFWAYTGGTDIPGAVGNLLRGLLKDDPQHRWTLDDVRRWQDGMQMKSHGQDSRVGLSRALRFQDKAYKDGGLLATEFANAPEKALSALKADEFRHNLINVMEQNEDPEEIEKLLPAKVFRSTEDEQYALARFCALVDPAGPIRYKSVKVMADGLGWAVADAFAENDEMAKADLVSLFSQRRLKDILAIMSRQVEVPGALTTVATNLGPVTEQQALGGGLERVLYALNPLLACQSTRLGGRYVVTLTQLLNAMESTIKSGDSPMDQHISAFCVEQDPECEPLLQKLNNCSAEQRAIRLLDVFGYLQRRYSSHPLPGLGKAMGGSLRRLCQSFHSKSRRNYLMTKLDKLATSGELSSMATALNLGAEKAADDAGYRQAKSQYKFITAELGKVGRQGGAAGPEARAMGYKGAFMLGMLILCMTVGSILMGEVL